MCLTSTNRRNASSKRSLPARFLKTSRMFHAACLRTRHAGSSASDTTSGTRNCKREWSERSKIREFNKIYGVFPCIPDG